MRWCEWPRLMGKRRWADVPPRHGRLRRAQRAARRSPASLPASWRSASFAGYGRSPRGAMTSCLSRTVSDPDDAANEIAPGEFSRFRAKCGEHRVALETLIHEAADRVATITFNRHAAMNATNDQFYRELSGVIRDIAAAAAVDSVILTGAGRGFRAGGKLPMELSGMDSGDGVGPRSFLARPPFWRASRRDPCEATPVPPRRRKSAARRRRQGTSAFSNPGERR